MPSTAFGIGSSNERFSPTQLGFPPEYISGKVNRRSGLSKLDHRWHWLHPSTLARFAKQPEPKAKKKVCWSEACWIDMLDRYDPHSPSRDFIAAVKRQAASWGEVGEDWLNVQLRAHLDTMIGNALNARGEEREGLALKGACLSEIWTSFL